jgi:hypothetical protein
MLAVYNCCFCKRLLVLEGVGTDVHDPTEAVGLIRCRSMIFPTIIITF